MLYGGPEKRETRHVVLSIRNMRKRTVGLMPPSLYVKVVYIHFRVYRRTR